MKGSGAWCVMRDAAGGWERAPSCVFRIPYFVFRVQPGNLASCRRRCLTHHAARNTEYGTRSAHDAMPSNRLTT